MAEINVRIRGPFESPTTADLDSVAPRAGDIRRQEAATNIGTGGPKTPDPRGGQNVETMSVKAPPAKKGGRGEAKPSGSAPTRPSPTELATATGRDVGKAVAQK